MTKDTEGHIHLKSVDSGQEEGEAAAEIVLSDNGFQFTVTFLYLLPFKKPQWIEYQQQKDQDKLKSSSLIDNSLVSMSSGFGGRAS